MTLKSALPYTLALAAGLSIAALAQAADPPIVISTGKSGGGYNTIGERLKTVLAEQDQAVQVLTSAGSGENLNRLADPNSPVSVGLTQADALQAYLKLISSSAWAILARNAYSSSSARTVIFTRTATCNNPKVG